MKTYLIEVTVDEQKLRDSSTKCVGCNIPERIKNVVEGALESSDIYYAGAITIEDIKKSHWKAGKVYKPNKAQNMNWDED